MTDVFDRVRAMPVVAEMWPREPGAGSEFAADAIHPEVSTYEVARVLLLEARTWLQASARIVNSPNSIQRGGAHILLLRPALVCAAKCAWVVRPDEPRERVSRAVRLVAQDRLQGVRAMKKAVELGAHQAFGDVGVAFDRSRNVVISASDGVAPDVHERPPHDESLIADLAGDVDQYYGSRDAKSEMQLLWNASSSLAHGERWYSSLTSGPRRSKVASILTTRSLDGVCSGINVTNLRVIGLAAARQVGEGPATTSDR